MSTQSKKLYASSAVMASATIQTAELSSSIQSSSRTSKSSSMSLLAAAFMSSRLPKQISARILFSIGNPHVGRAGPKSSRRGVVLSFQLDCRQHPRPAGAMARNLTEA